MVSISPRAPGRLAALHPGWYAAVMGTAIVGAAAAQNPGGVAALAEPARWLGVGMTALACLLALALGVPYVWRWFAHGEAARADLAQPLLGAMYATFPGGLLVLAVAVGAALPAVLPAPWVFALGALLAALGATLAFAASLAFTYSLVTVARTADDAANGGWFIPPVVNAIVPLALAPLVPAVTPEAGRALVLIGYAAWGIGFFLFVLVASLLFNRLVHQPLPPGPLAPTLVIALGPIAVCGLAPLRLTQVGATVLPELAGAPTTLAALLALALWGFALWWLALSALLLGRYLSRGGLTYSLGWWAFTFPLGAFTVQTLAVARAWRAASLEWLGALFFLLLLAAWLLVCCRTVTALRVGTIWQR